MALVAYLLGRPSLGTDGVVTVGDRGRWPDQDEPELRKQLDALRKDMQHVKEWLAAITLLLVILLLLLVSFRSAQ